MPDCGETLPGHPRAHFCTRGIAGWRSRNRFLEHGNVLGNTFLAPAPDKVPHIFTHAIEGRSLGIHTSEICQFRVQGNINRDRFHEGTLTALAKYVKPCHRTDLRIACQSEAGRPNPRSHGTIIKSGPRPGKSRLPACPSHEFFARAGSDRPGSDEKNQGI